MTSFHISRSLLASILCLFAAAGRSHALDPARHISQYGHTAWRVQDGSISAPGPITQTKDGYIWIGTSDGLMRFDGVRFVPWTPPGETAFPSRNFTFLLGARDGSLWIGTARGLLRLKDNHLQNYSTGEGPYGVGEVMEDRNGNIWVARYNLAPGAAPLCQVAGDALRCFGQAEGIPARYGLALTEDGSGNIWFGSTVLCRWNRGSSTGSCEDESKRALTGDGVVAVKATSDGLLWAAEDATGPQFGVRQFKDGKWSTFSVPGFDGRSIRAHVLLADHDRSLWVGTGQGLYRIHDGVADHYSTADGLSGDVVGALYEDRELNLWVVTDGGVDMLRNTPVTTYTTRQGLSSAVIRALAATRDGKVWVANEAAVDILSGGPDHMMSVARSLPGRDVLSFYEDNAGTLWIGVDNSLLTYQNGHFQEIRSQDGKPIAGSGGIYAITEDGEGNIWAIGNKHLYRIRNRQVRESVELSSQFRLNYGLLAADPSGGLWFTTSRTKLTHFRSGQFENVSLPLTSTPATIYGLIVDREDSLMMPTSEGLYRLNGSRWTVLDSNNGLPCNRIFSLIKDAHGSVWLYAQCGLLRIDSSDFKRWRDNPQTKLAVITLDARDGAHPGQQTMAQPAAVQSVDGRLWFLNGLMVQSVDPEQLYKNTAPPPVYVESVSADGRKYLRQGQLELPALTRDLEIDYTALSFTIPQKLRFRYMLEGHDHAWQEVENRRQAFYTDLGPGKYRFRVVGANNDGVWNQEGDSLSFSVLPAWYQTTWFKIALVAAITLTLWTLYRLRVRQVAHALSVRFDERLAERTRIARDLHDTFLQTVQGSKMVADDALDTPLDQNRMRRALEQLSIWLEQAIHEGRNALNSLRSSATMTNDLAEGLRRATHPLSESQSMLVSVSVVGESREMHPIVRDEVYRIGYEAIRNAQVHSRATSLEVELSYGHDLQLRVRDNGIGMDSALTDHGKDGHFGLHGMRERAARIGGKLTIQSSAGSGTNVTLIVPGAITFLGRIHHSSQIENTTSQY